MSVITSTICSCSYSFCSLLQLHSCFFAMVNVSVSLQLCLQLAGLFAIAYCNLWSSVRHILHFAGIIAIACFISLASLRLLVMDCWLHRACLCKFATECLGCILQSFLGAHSSLQAQHLQCSCDLQGSLQCNLLLQIVDFLQAGNFSCLFLQVCKLHHSCSCKFTRCLALALTRVCELLRNHSCDTWW